MDENTKAFTQLSFIIARMDRKIKEKIPLDIRKEISKRKNNRCVFEYDETLPLKKQKLLPETKAMLSVLYSEYISDEKEKWDEFDTYKNKIANKK